MKSSEAVLTNRSWTTVFNAKRVILYVLICMSSMWIAVKVSSWIELTGVRLPWGRHETDYLAGLAAALVLGLLLLIAPVQERNRLHLLLAWLIKCFVVLGFMLGYESNYDSLDAYSYHELARLGVYEAADLNWGRGTQLVIYTLQILYEVLPPSYHLAKVLFSFVGLVGVYLVYQAWSFYTMDQSRKLFYILMLFPGLLFWSSTLGKDPVIIFAIGLYLYGLVNFLRRNRSVGFILIIVGIGLAGAIRPWMAIILLIPLFVGIFISYRGAKRWLTSVGLTIGLAASALLFGESAAYSIRLDAINQMSSGWSEGGSAQVPPVFDSYAELVVFIPVGAFTALFRPLPGEIINTFGMMASVENVLLLGMLGLGARHWRRSLLQDRLYVMLCSLVMVWAMAYGLVSYQNLGTAVRFKAQILPVLIIVMWWPFWAWKAMQSKSRLVVVIRRDVRL